MVIHQSTTHMGSSSGSEYRASKSILDRANTTAELAADATSTQRLQPRSPDLPLKKTTYIFRVSIKVLNKSNPTHGGG